MCTSGRPIRRMSKTDEVIHPRLVLVFSLFFLKERDICQYSVGHLELQELLELYGLLGLLELL